MESLLFDQLFLYRLVLGEILSDIVNLRDQIFIPFYPTTSAGVLILAI